MHTSKVSFSTLVASMSACVSCMSVNRFQRVPVNIVFSGNTSLPWIARVQIALDAARGLEYIHEHTKTHYVHRDIKTSNILLDSAFRAKVFTHLGLMNVFCF